MSLRLPRMLGLSTAAVLLAAAGARADTISYGNFASTAGLALAGSATTQGSALSITQAGDSYVAGAAYVTTPFTLGPDGGFSARFQFSIASGPVGPADGFTFTLAQSFAGDPLQTGGNLGYLGLDHSVAIEFDTYYNGSPQTGGYPIADGGTDDSNDNHVGINVNGLLNDYASGSPYGVGDGAGNAWACAYAGSPFGCMGNGDLWTVMIGYSNHRLSVSVQDGGAAPWTVIDGYGIDIPALIGTSTPQIGFTGAVGGLSSSQDIQNLYVAQDQSNAPVPEPGSLALLGSGLVGLLAWRRRAHG